MSQLVAYIKMHQKGHGYSEYIHLGWNAGKELLIGWWQWHRQKWWWIKQQALFLLAAVWTLELFSLVYCTSWRLKGNLTSLSKVLSGHNYHKPVHPERWQYLTALGIWEAFFSLSKQLSKFSWLISSDRLVYSLKNFFLMYPTLYTVEPCISCCLLHHCQYFTKVPFLAPFYILICYSSCTSWLLFFRWLHTAFTDT